MDGRRRWTRGLLERVVCVRGVGRAKCKGARGRESPWRYYVQVHFDVNRFGKLVKISVATERPGGRKGRGRWMEGADGSRRRCKEIVPTCPLPLGLMSSVFPFMCGVGSV